MNKILKLKGELTKTHPTEFHIGPPQLPSAARVSNSKLERLARQLESISTRWKDEGFVNSKPLVSVRYNRIVPKSRRMKRLLSEKRKSSDDSIVGAKFWEDGDGTPRHQIVHCVTQEAIALSVMDLRKTANALQALFGGEIDAETLSSVNRAENSEHYDKEFKALGISRSAFTRILADVADVDRFVIDMDADDFDDDVIATLYSTDLSIPRLFDKIGLDYIDTDMIDANTIIMKKDQYDILRAKAPYLIAMSLVEHAETPRDHERSSKGYRRSIDPPKGEPIIGVIDTLFDKDPERVYFADWVDFRDMVNPNVPRDERSYLHGTKVSSIIVDGPALNPFMEDGCGRFRVRHFGVAANDRISLFFLAKHLRSIVSNNTDIKVWNFSLGSSLPVSRYSISPIAAIIDQIECEFDVTFVIAGTNDPDPKTGFVKRIGSPADSINSIVVNAVNREGNPASYSRRGPVLEFYEKPDICYFGGDVDGYCLTWANGAEYYSKGTSFASPWIARKLAFLVQVMGLPRETAKALIIDSALGWSKRDADHVMGYGIVPTHIRDILQSADDEIRFVISGTAGPYETYSYRIPVPVYKGGQPYYARATLCYLPSCSRIQGVDYTNTEIDLKFGRLVNGKVKPINNDMQGDPRDFTNESEARRYYRKWDNVKVVGETIKTRRIPKKTYASPYWGISMTTKKRLDGEQREELRFGLVVTLKEMNGANRIENFIKNCLSANWTVESIDIDTSVDIYEIGDEEIEFD